MFSKRVLHKLEQYATYVFKEERDDLLHVARVFFEVPDETFEVGVPVLHEQVAAHSKLLV